MTRSFPIGAAVAADELARDPHRTLARLRADEPVSWLPALGCWLVTSRELALQVLRDPVAFTVDDPRFSTAQVVGPSMLSLDGAAHARVRKPFVAPFRPARVAERFTATITEHAHELVAGIRQAGVADLRTAFAGPLAVQVVADALGIPGIAPDALLTWYGTFVDAVSAVTAGSGVPAGVSAAYDALAEHVLAGIDDHDSLLADAVARGLERAEVVSNAAVLLFGGIETTEGMILNLMFHLFEHPLQLAAARADPGLLPIAVEESLRLEPAAAVVDRYATRDVELGGTPIRRGDPVTVSIAGANRDPAAYPDPDTFDLRRPAARQHLAFASGPHSCPAMDLARLETTIGVGVLLASLPGLAPAGRVTPSGLVFRKPQSLPARWDAPPGDAGS